MGPGRLAGMLAETAVALDEVSAAHAARLRGLDPLLGPPPPLVPGEDGDLITVAGPVHPRAAADSAAGTADSAAGTAGSGAGAAGSGTGGLVGFAVARVREVDVGSLDASWSAAQVYQVSARVAGPDPGGALDSLLRQWRETLPEEAAEDSAAALMWPSRDTVTAPVLIRHGLSPLVVIAARPAGRAEPADVPAGVTVRRAVGTDLADIVALRLATIRYDAQFGVVRERPATADLLRQHSERFFARDDPWVWVAERDGAVAGMVAVDQPPHADWIAGLTSVGPVAYVDVLGMYPGSRGTGAGGALLAHAHQALDEAGVAVTLLHHALPNPLSTPFYGRHGYRPLYTFWETRPATTLR